MLELYRKILSSVTRMKLKKISVDLDAKFKDGRFEFWVTVFGGHGENRGIAFYDFYEMDRMDKALKRVVDLIRKDDFSITCADDFKV